MIFDAHFHIFDPKYPLESNQNFTPDYFSLEDYFKKIKVDGGALISSSFQSYDQEFLINSLNLLGKNFVGVTQLPTDTPDQEILSLHKKGIRGVRFNLYRGASDHNLIEFAKRIHDLAGWHVELYAEPSDLFYSLPKVTIDHLGFSPKVLELVDRGVKVKASGFSRLECNPIELMQQIYALNPDALMFGSDLPGTRAPTPFTKRDLEHIEKAFPKKALEKILWKNAEEFYLS